MTREAFERLCFGDWVPSAMDWWSPPMTFREALIEGVRRAKRDAAQPFSYANPDDAQHFTVTPTKYYVPSDDYSELHEITMGDPREVLPPGTRFQWGRYTTGGQHSELIPEGDAVVESVDYERGVVRFRGHVPWR